MDCILIGYPIYIYKFLYWLRNSRILITWRVTVIYHTFMQSRIVVPRTSILLRIGPNMRRLNFTGHLPCFVIRSRCMVHHGARRNNYSPVYSSCMLEAAPYVSTLRSTLICRFYSENTNTCSTAETTQCRICKKSISLNVIVCPHCQRLQTVRPEWTYYTLFGVPEKSFTFDEGLLKTKYRALAASVHPDTTKEVKTIHWILCYRLFLYCCVISKVFRCRVLISWSMSY